MKSGGCFMASLMLVQLVCSGHSVRRPAHVARAALCRMTRSPRCAPRGAARLTAGPTGGPARRAFGNTAVVAFQERSGQSYSVERVMSWAPDEDGNMRKVEREIQKRGFFDGEKWRSGTTVTEWENGVPKTYWVEGEPELNDFPLPRTRTQLSRMADMRIDPHPFFEMEDMLQEIFPRERFFRRGLGGRIPSYTERLRTWADHPTQWSNYHEMSAEDPSVRQRVQTGWAKVRESASGFLGKVADTVGRGWRALARALASAAGSRANPFRDTTVWSESKTVEFRVSDDGLVEGKETVTNFKNGKWDTVERPLEPEVVEGLLEKARRMTTEPGRVAPKASEVIEAEFKPKK